MGAREQALRQARDVSRPVRRIISTELENARKSSSRALTREEALFVAVASVAVVVLAVMTRAMYFAKYSTLTAEDFATYHPLVPWLTIAGSVAYVLALRVKGVKYWLTYFPAVLAILASVVLLALMAGELEPESLRFFDFGWSWWRGT